jgi:hypothetical protein
LTSEYVMEDFPHHYSEFRNGKFSDPVQLQYICSIVSELSYHEVTSREIDQFRRLRIIPAENYQKILQSRLASSVSSFSTTGLFREGDADIQQVQTDNFAVLALNFEDTLFLSFRGTVATYGPDWKVNCNSKIAKVLPLPDLYAPIGVHSGLLNEAIGLLFLLKRRLARRTSKRVYFVGHSLGGALASTCASLLQYEYWRGDRDDIFGIARKEMVGFGTPRHGNESFHWLDQASLPKTFYKNQGDLVTCVPSKSLGYIGNPEQRTPFLTPICDEVASVQKFRSMFRWGRFLRSGARPHRIEQYRKTSRMALDGHLDDRQFCNLENIRLPKKGEL